MKQTQREKKPSSLRTLAPGAWNQAPEARRAAVAGLGHIKVNLLSPPETTSP